MSISDKLYRTLTFKVKTEDREVIYSQIVDNEFVELVRPFGNEVIELNIGQGVDRLVVH